MPELAAGSVVYAALYWLQAAAGFEDAAASARHPGSKNHVLADQQLYCFC